VTGRRDDVGLLVVRDFVRQKQDRLIRAGDVDPAALGVCGTARGQQEEQPRDGNAQELTAKRVHARSGAAVAR
jgi:hypothetical protein